MTGNGNGGHEDFVTGLGKMFAGFGWAPAEVERALPKMVRILLDVGILQERPDGAYEPTDLVGDDDAWAQAWARADKENIAGSKPAS